MSQKDPTGKKISRQVAHDMIKAYEERPLKAGKGKLMSLLVSKEVLNNLIAQDKCENVLLYFGIKPTALADPDYLKNSLIETTYVNLDTSLILVGADGNGNPITENGEYYDDLGHCPPDPPPSPGI